MTITINLPPATMENLEAQAKAIGKDINTLVTEAVETKLALSKVSFAEVLQPLQEAVAASGMSPEEAERTYRT